MKMEKRYVAISRLQAANSAHFTAIRVPKERKRIVTFSSMSIV